MNIRLPWRAAAALICVLLLPAVSLFFDRASLHTPVRDPSTCLGVPILADSPPASAGGEAPRLLYQGMDAPLDPHTGTLYLSVSAPEGCAPCSLTGTLGSADPRATLAFAPDPAFDDLPAAIAAGHAFRLLVLRGDEAVSEYAVVMTPLPVICMDTTDGSDYGDPYAGHSGRVRVFEPGAAGTSEADWHRRGMTTRLFKKGSWKLSLTNRFSRPRNLAIAGLGSDDDWILNSMGMDDLCLREMLVTRLWNDMAGTRASPMRMADCAYAEVLLDGAYMGLYLLQRRVDAKYLGLEQSRDVLLKGSNHAYAKDATEGFTVRSSPLSERESQMLAQPLFDLSDISGVELDAWLDMNAFVLFGAMYDNSAIRNAYYILRPQAKGYRIALLPWDTDLSFGLGYVQGRGQVLLPLEEGSLPVAHRREYDALAALYPDLDARIAAHWSSLRRGTLSEENIENTLSSILQILDGSGAYARNKALWGVRYSGNDTLERLDAFIDMRLEQVDAAYTLQ